MRPLMMSPAFAVTFRKRRSMRIAVTAALLASMIAGPAMAKTAPHPSKVPPAKTAPAKPSLAQLAAQGDPQAQYHLGLAYSTGKGARKNPAEAAAWFALAAGNGQAEAAVALAKAYEQGSGVKRDPVQAAQWWRHAGLLGDADAKARFVQLFLAGQTDDIGGPTGAGWLEEMAKTGDARAILALGRAYEDGRGVVADPAKARAWYLQAAYGGDADAQFRLGRMLLDQPGAWRLIYTDPDEEAKNTERGVYYPTRDAARAAAKGSQIPDVVRPGMVEAEMWLRAAARQGHAEAAYTLGMAFLGGMDLPIDVREAMHWLSAAAWGGHAKAMMELAGLAADGVGFAGKDPVRAWVNYTLAANQGLKPAEEARTALGKTMNARQLNRARQLAQDVRFN